MQPVVSARGLGLRTRRGWVFRDVDLDVNRGELVALPGPAGSGRTSLLLALAGRFKITDGTLERHGRAALAYVPGVTDPDPNLTVAEHVQERRLLLGRAARMPLLRGTRMPLLRGSSGIREAGGHYFPGVVANPHQLGRDLSPLGKHRLGLTLATLDNPDLILVDDADTGLSTAERNELWAELQGLADAGHAVIATCREDLR